MIEINAPDTLFVLGNGFDIQCGLQTSYINFMEDKFSNTGINILSRIIQNAVDEYHHLDGELKVIDDYDNISELSIWYIILLYKKQNKNSDWSNIENQILEELREVDNGEGKTLNIIDKFAVALLNELKNKSYSNNEMIYPNDIDNIYGVCAYILLKIKKDEVLVEKINQVFEEYVENDIIKNTKLFEELKDIASEILLKELHVVENDFKLYLEEEIKRKSKEYSEKTISLFRSLYHIMGNKDNNKIYFNILSFNYTSPWISQSGNIHDYYSRHLDKYINIHGNYKLGNIIFGIDEDKISYNKREYLFTKTSRTLELYTDEAKHYCTSIQDLLPNTIKTVAFYGHSLSEADYGYFRLVFDKYINDNKVCFKFYFSVYEGTTKEKEMKKLRDRISIMFGKYSEEKSENRYVFVNLIQAKRIIFLELNICDYK